MRFINTNNHLSPQQKLNQVFNVIQQRSPPLHVKQSKSGTAMFGGTHTMVPQSSRDKSTF